LPDFLLKPRSEICAGAPARQPKRPVLSGRVFSLYFYCTGSVPKYWSAGPAAARLVIWFIGEVSDQVFVLSSFLHKNGYRAYDELKRHEFFVRHFIWNCQLRTISKLYRWV